MAELEFERPINDLKNKIQELKQFMEEKGIDLTTELKQLEERLEKLENDTYENLKPWHRVQIARFPERPTTLDYIEYLFTDFIELHGDRLYADEPAIVGGIAKYK